MGTKLTSRLRNQPRISRGADPPLAAVSGSLPQREGAWGRSLQRRAEPGCPSLPPVRIKRIRDKYEVELQELERSERKLQERCNELKGRLAELEGESARLQGLLKHKEQEMEEIRKVGEEQSLGLWLFSLLRALPGSVPWHRPVPIGASVFPLCPAAGEGPAGPGAEQPGRSHPAGGCGQAGGDGGGEQAAEGRDGGDESPAAPGAGQGGAGEGPGAGGGSQEVRLPGLRAGLPAGAVGTELARGASQERVCRAASSGTASRPVGAKWAAELES